MKWFIPGLVFGLVYFWFFVDYVQTAVIDTTLIVESGTELTQADYRWYENKNAITPTIPLTDENTATTTPATNTILRLRINIGVAGIKLDDGASFTLQFSTATSSGWADIGTSTTDWVFANNAGVSDGQTITTTVLSSSDVGESYDESNPSAASPNDILHSQKGEWDWVIKNSTANVTSTWYFRMIFSSSTLFDTYTRYPTLVAGSEPSTEDDDAGSGGGNLGVTPTPGTGVSLPVIPSDEIPVPIEVLNICDFNVDKVCDIIDLSIILFHYNQLGIEHARYDLNRNGIVDFPDISILMFYWVE